MQGLASTLNDDPELTRRWITQRPGPSVTSCSDFTPFFPSSSPFCSTMVSAMINSITVSINGIGASVLPVELNKLIA
jgi:hypothetical protein